jgi:hypothetical protein
MRVAHFLFIELPTVLRTTGTCRVTHAKNQMKSHEPRSDGILLRQTNDISNATGTG